MSTIKLIRLIAAVSFIAFANLTLQIVPASASSSASPDPAVPGETVTVTPTTEQCSDRLDFMIPNSWGWWEVTWPDATTTIVDPATDPLVIAVPSAMSVGTASVVLVSDDGVVFPFCDTTFEVAADATVPVVEPAVGIGAVGLLGAGFVLKNLLRRRQSAVL